MSRDDDHEWCDYEGYVVAETPQAVGFGPNPEDVEVWVPKRLLGAIEYEENGDSAIVSVGEEVRGFELPGWLKLEKGL